MSLNIAIDPANAAASTSSQGALPDGDYPMKIVIAADKVSKKGNRMIEVVFETEDAKAQRVWHYFNLFHANPDVQRIALSEFTQLGMAIGVAKVDNTDELLGRSLSVTLKTEKNPEYGDRNKAVKFAALSSPAPVAAQPSSLPWKAA